MTSAKSTPAPTPAPGRPTISSGCQTFTEEAVVRIGVDA